MIYPTSEESLGEHLFTVGSVVIDILRSQKRALYFEDIQDVIQREYKNIEPDTVRYALILLYSVGGVIFDNYKISLNSK